MEKDEHKKRIKRLDEMLETLQEMQARLDKDLIVTLEARIARKLEIYIC